jgi:hypothetical protein
MIKLQELTPHVYYNQSRDFQFIGRLYDIVLNAVKTNADMIYSVPSADAAGSKMIDLLALTLGFKASHNYNVKQLISICSILPLILRNKGNIQAILLVGQALLNSEGITDTFSYSIDAQNPYLIQLFVPPALSDLNLLKDLLTYIIPAGMDAQIVRASTQYANASTLVIPQFNITTYGLDKENAGMLFNPSHSLPTDSSAVVGRMVDSAVLSPKDKGSTLITISTNTENTEQENTEDENNG